MGVSDDGLHAAWLPRGSWSAPKSTYAMLLLIQAEEYQVSGTDTHSSHITSQYEYVHLISLELVYKLIPVHTSTYHYMADGCTPPGKATAISKKGEHLLTAVHFLYAAPRRPPAPRRVNPLPLGNPHSSHGTYQLDRKYKRL